MFSNFKATFKEFSIIENPLFNMSNIPFKYKELLLDCGGKSYDHGLYSIHTFKDSLKWTALLSGYFKKYENAVLSFGYDWMGRQYCVPTKTNECVFMFDPATQEDYYVEENLFDFHNDILLNSKTESLSSDTFEQVLDYLKIYSIEYSKFIGFKTSLFLGGKVDLPNYEVIDMEVYWDFEHQIFQQTSKVPRGTQVTGAAIAITGIPPAS